MSETVVVPVWVAPRGRKRTDIELGSRVEFDAILERATDEKWQEGDPFWCGWRRLEMDEPRTGVIVGLRFPYSRQLKEYRSGGSIYEPPEYFAYRDHAVTHRAYLIATDLRTRHVRVLSEDIRPLAPTPEQQGDEP